MSQKVHCTFYEIYGPDWANLNQSQVDCIIESIQSSPMIGNEPELRGFVGTTRINNVIGGFFAIQYEENLEYYNKAKEVSHKRETPFEKLLFVIFADKGKALLQHKKFSNNSSLNMETAKSLFIRAFNLTATTCKLFIISMTSPKQRVSNETFIEEFNSSSRVSHLTVTDPKPEQIPDEMVYYNPQRERNDIIRLSHKHDYPQFRKVDLEASEGGDIKVTHIGKDIVRAGEPQVMKYEKNNQERILRRDFPIKFEFTIDMDQESLSREHLETIIQMITRESALGLDNATPEPDQKQRSLFEIDSEG